MWDGTIPCAGLADFYSGAGKIFSETLVVFYQTPELELGHGLTTACARAHSLLFWMCLGRSEDGRHKRRGIYDRLVVAVVVVEYKGQEFGWIVQLCLLTTVV